MIVGSPCGLYALSAVSMTDVGCVRQTNQDSYFYDLSLGVFVVCDGMGGHLGGEVASAIAVEEFTHLLSFSDYSLRGFSRSYCDYLLEFVNDIDRKIEDKGRFDFNLRSMGTTVVGLVLTDVSVDVFHMGDSRAYYLGSDMLKRLTEDHSSVQEDQSDCENLHMITNAMGYPQKGSATYSSFDLREGLYVLCSDGLWSMIEEGELESCLQDKQLSLSEKCRSLILLARDRGGDDNMTLMIVEVKKKK